MANNSLTITVIGNLTNDVELRFTPSGSAVANFTIASTPRTYDQKADEWKDGETVFLRSTLWREQAQNAAESLTKGTRVVVEGQLKSRTYETKDGEKRTVLELEIEEIGASLRYSTAKLTRNQPRGNGQADGQRAGEDQSPTQGGQEQNPAQQQEPGGFWGN